ncbi:MAG: hypothetical protein ACYC92_01115 [Candidatus Acidiferrales bacterium]
MTDEPADATPDEIANEEGLLRFEAEVLFRQSNILPMDSALNVGRFYGLLIRAQRPRNGMERVGFIFMAVLWLMGGFPGLSISWLLIPLGFKLLWTACRRAEREPAAIA